MPAIEDQNVTIEEFFEHLRSYLDEKQIALVKKAYEFAAKKHADQKRRSGEPYIIHPTQVAYILAQMKMDEETLAAAFLHDVVEDTDITLDDIRSRFGDRVAKLVDTESDRPGRVEDWLARKEDSLKRLSAASREEKIVALGDKLSNMRAIARDYTTEGESFWERFHVKDKSVHAWRYHALLDALSSLADTYAWHEFKFLVNRVFPVE